MIKVLPGMIRVLPHNEAVVGEIVRGLGRRFLVIDVLHPGRQFATYLLLDLRTLRVDEYAPTSFYIEATDDEGVPL